MYSSAGKLAAYKELSVSAFMQGYLIVMHSEDTEAKDKMAQHLDELMSDATCMDGRRYGSTMGSG